MFLIATIALVISLSQSKSPGNAENGETAFGGGVWDDGSPALISKPSFYKDRHGQAILRINYTLKRPNEVPGGTLTMWLKGGREGSYQGHFQAPRQFTKSELQNEGTLDLPLYNFLKMPASFGARLPDCELYWESGARRISNVLTIRLPANPDGLPTDPELVRVAGQLSQFRVQLTNARYDSSFFPKMFVEIRPERGSPVAGFEYALVCKQKAAVGGFSKDQKLDPDFLARGGELEVSSPTGFHSNSTYELQVEAYPPGQREASAVISNTLNLPGPPAR